MPAYKSMSAIEALRHAKEVSGLTLEELSGRTGIRPSSLRRYFQQEEGYCPGLDKLPALILAFGNTVLLDWLDAQTERRPEKIAPARSRAEALTAVARASASPGDCHRALADSEKRGLDPHCAREARSELSETITLCRRAMAMLEYMAKGRDRLEREPLAIIAEARKRKWWQVWK